MTLFDLGGIGLRTFSLRSAWPSLVIRQWASAARSKAAGKQKQQFRKRHKDAILARASATSTERHSTKDALTSALFESSHEEMATDAQDGPCDAKFDDRAVIGKAWSRMRMLSLHVRSSWERAYLQSRLDAMAELTKVSPRLAEHASRPDYQIPPLHRRLPTDTPPEPAKFPFAME